MKINQKNTKLFETIIAEYHKYIRNGKISKNADMKVLPNILGFSQNDVQSFIKLTVDVNNWINAFDIIKGMRHYTKKAIKLYQYLFSEPLSKQLYYASSNPKFEGVLKKGSYVYRMRGSGVMNWSHGIISRKNRAKILRADPISSEYVLLANINDRKIQTYLNSFGTFVRFEKDSLLYFLLQHLESLIEYGSVEREVITINQKRIKCFVTKSVKTDLKEDID